MPVQFPMAKGCPPNIALMADLGTIAWGLYLYRGRIVGDEFTARYDCGIDHGTFFMERRDAVPGSAP